MVSPLVDHPVVCLFGCPLAKVIYRFSRIVFRDDIVLLLIKTNKMQINMLHLLNSLLANTNILVSEPSSLVKNFKCIPLICRVPGFLQ